MKPGTTLAIMGALGIAFSSALYAQTAPADGTQPDGPRSGGRRMGPPKEILQKYDANQDGKLDETERAALQQDIQDGKIQPPPPGPRGPRGPRMGPPKEILEKYDANQDGTLDETERAAMRKDVEDGKLQPPPFAGGRGPRPSPPSATEILEKFDADKDGKLDQSELTTFLSAHRPPPGPHGPPPEGAPDSGAAPQQ